MLPLRVLPRMYPAIGTRPCLNTLPPVLGLKHRLSNPGWCIDYVTFHRYQFLHCLST